MPTYEYKCPKCGNKFDESQKMTAKPVAKCPKCGAKAERQMSAGAGLVFKGSGFYLTDYGRAGQKAKQQESGDKSSGEKKSSGETKSSGEKKPDTVGSDKPVPTPKSKPKDD